MVVRLLGVCLLTVALFGCSAAQKNFNEGRELEQQGRYEEAMLRYAESVKAEPDKSEYRIGFLKSREAAARARERRGDELSVAGQYGEAVNEFQAATALDGSQNRYLEKAKAAAQARDGAGLYQEGLGFEKGNKLREAAVAYQRALELAPDRQEYRQAVERLAGLRKSRLEARELQLKSDRPITLRFRDARLRDVFQSLGQLSGISFIFDAETKEQQVSIEFEKATFQQVFELLTGMYKLGHKSLNETTVLLYSRTPEKNKQYEELVVRTFHLNHLEAKKALNLIRGVVQVRKLYLNEEGNALVLRDTASVAAVVERILEANDLPEAEVVLDVEVVEVNDSSGHDLGLLLSNYNVSMGAFNPEGKLLSPSLSKSLSPVTAPVDASQLLKAFSSKGFGGYVTVPNASYNFGKTLARGEVLSNPKIRIKNKEKARFTVGQRVPVQTTSSTGTITSSNVTYVDVGIKLNAEPNIQLNNEVTVKLGLEVSSVINKETSKADGTTLLTIGTRNLDTVLSLKDGETVIIGGLMRNSDTDSSTRVFMLGDLPLLGPLLSNNVKEKEKNELLLAITPRLVRGVTVPSRSLARFDSGREDDPALTHPYGSFVLEPEYRKPSGP